MTMFFAALSLICSLCNALFFMKKGNVWRTRTIVVAVAGLIVCAFTVVRGI